MKYKLLVITLIVLIAGCAAPVPEPVEVEVTRIVEQTRIVQETVIVTQIVEVTSTPVPPSPTPVFSIWSLEQAQTAFLDAGLEFADPYEMTKDDYGLAPLSAEKGLRFIIPSLCSTCGGRLYTFSNQADLDLMYKYYDELGRQSAMLFSWVFAKDNLLIQINGDLPETKALEYQAALNNLVP